MTELKKANQLEVSKIPAQSEELAEGDLKEADHELAKTDINLENHTKTTGAEPRFINTETNTALKGPETLLSNNQDLTNNPGSNPEDLKNLLNHLLDNKSSKDGQETDYASINKHVTGV